MRESDKEVKRDVNCGKGLNPAKEGGKGGKGEDTEGSTVLRRFWESLQCP